MPKAKDGQCTMVLFPHKSNPANTILERGAYKKCGGHIGTLVLRQRAKKAGLLHELQQITMSKTELHNKNKKAYWK